MNLRSIFVLAFCFMAISAGAQSPIPFQFSSEDENRFIKENDSFKFYVATGDTENILAIDEDALLYKLYNHNQKLIAEGSFIAEGDKFLQEGKWTEFYANGKVKLTGCCYRNSPIGTWEEYYPNGRIKVVSNYGMFSDQGAIVSCLSGSYSEYFQNGKLKVTGFYSAAFASANDTVMVTDPVSGQEVTKIIEHKKLNAVKAGAWEHYDENGELEKKEDL